VSSSLSSSTKKEVTSGSASKPSCDRSSSSWFLRVLQSPNDDSSRQPCVQAQTDPNPHCNTHDAYPDMSGLPQLIWTLDNNISLSRIHLKGCDIQLSLGVLTLVRAISNLKGLTELDLEFFFLTATAYPGICFQ
ncbi:hypothetical protein BG015_005552, partial [Linnemannia schmuckeri]